MKRRLAGVIALLFLCAGIASAHRLDEYLQATILSIGKDHIDASMRMIPGIAVSSAVIASIDTDGDGRFSTPERSTYAEGVLQSLSIRIDGNPLTPQLLSMSFPEPEQIRQGLGEIHIEFRIPIPPGGRNRSLVLENHHQNRKSAYLVNALVPADPAIQITAQTRNEQQSFYRLDYLQTGPSADSSPAAWSTGIHEALGAVGFVRVFRLGMRHIAEGTDHLLFLLALLLPAPLLARRGRWAECAGPRRSLLRILSIVTAFTLGHSITLALAACGLVSVPARPVEVLIAVSILVSAIHALRPLFPGKEAGIAAFFGLVHGLAFASTLADLGLRGWPRAIGILAFNSGIETMQLIVVAVTLPSLLLLSATRAYPFLRIGGGLFAAIAAAGWIDERLLGRHNPLDRAIELASSHAAWFAGILFLVGVACFLVRPSYAETLPIAKPLPASPRRKTLAMPPPEAEDYS